MYGNGVFVDKSSTFARDANQVDPNENQGLADILNVWMSDYAVENKVAKTDKMYGSAIPYLFNIMGDLLINPSTVSPSTFKKMVETDNMIGACMRYNVDSIINSIGLYTHPNKEVQKTMRTCIKRLKRGWRTFQRDILTNLYAGFSNSEMIWGYDDEIGGDIIVNTQPLPQNTVVNRVTPQGALQPEGIGQYIFNSFFPGFSSLFSYGIGNVFSPLLGGEFTNQSVGGAIGGYGDALSGGTDPYAQTGDLDYPYRTYMISPIGLVWIPIDKVVKATYYEVTNNVNPYGKSILRKVYNLWVTKYAVWQFMLRALKSKSAPLLALFGNPNIPMGNYGQGGVNDPNAEPSQPRNVIAELTEAAQQLESTSYLTLSGMPGEIVDIKSFPNEANIEVMEKIMRYIDEMIASALYVPRTLFGGGGEGRGSHSLSQTHEDVHYRWVMSAREDHENVLLEEYIRPMMEELFTPEEYDGYLGAFETAVISVDEQLKLAQTFEKAIQGGYVDPMDLNDMNHMREAIDFEKMDKVIQKFEQEVKPTGGKTMSNRDVHDATNTPYAHNVS